MENPTLVKDFNDVMTFIKQQGQRIKTLEKRIKDLEEENKKLNLIIYPLSTSKIKQKNRDGSCSD